MHALELSADTKSCRDLSHHFRVELSRLLGEKKKQQNLLPSGARTWNRVCSPAPSNPQLGMESVKTC